MMLKQLTNEERAIFEIGLVRGSGWEDIANEMMVPKSYHPAIRALYFKTVRNRKKVA